MTYCRILLHGGYAGRWDNAGCDLPLFQKLIDAAQSADRRLMISFLAQEKASDFIRLDELIETFGKLAPSIELVIADRTNFHALLPHHKVVFLQGGSSQAQQKFLSGTSKEELLYNKVMLAGSSSGASMLCDHGFSGSSQPVKGVNIVNLCVMPHANSWPIEEYLPSLRAASDAPILFLKEYEIVEMDIKVG